MNLLWSMLKMLTGAYARSDMREVEKGNPPKSWIGRLFATFAWGLEIVAEAARIVKLWDDLDYAAGSVLDRYGNTYGVQREGTDDDFYRVMIKVKMIAQVSGGDTDTVIQAAAALYGLEPEQIEVEEIFPAKGRVYVNAEDISETTKRTAGIIGRLLKRIVACGVGLDVIFQLIEAIDAQIYVGAGITTVIEDTARINYRTKYPESEREISVHATPFLMVEQSAKLTPKSGGTVPAPLYVLPYTHTQITLYGGGIDNA